MARFAPPLIRPVPSIARPVPNISRSLTRVAPPQPVASIPQPTAGIAFDRPQAKSAARSPTIVAATLAAAFVLASAALSLYLAQVSSVATAGYQLEQLEAERKEWQSRNGQLELELAKRHSLVWTDAQAGQRLGMVPAERPTYISVAPLSTQPCIPSTGCGPDVAASSSPVQTPVETRPQPGNPGQVLGDVLSWLASLHRPGG